MPSGLFKYFKLMFMQHRDGNTDDESWEAWSRHMLMQFHQPGVQAWWSLRQTTFSPRIQKIPQRVRTAGHEELRRADAIVRADSNTS